MPYSNRWELIHLLGGKCVDCAEENFYLLEIDHINNDGDGERQFYTNTEKRYISNPIRAKQRLAIRCKKCHEIRHTVPKIDRRAESLSKLRLFIDILKKGEVIYSDGVPKESLIKEMVQTMLFTEVEALQMIHRMAREASIYESKTGAYLHV